MVGLEHGGMAAMFTMMNAARLSVGLEGLAVSERAYQQALAYAHERTQGRAGGAAPGASSPIFDHPDDRWMLLLMASGIAAMLLLIFRTSAAPDRTHQHTDVLLRSAAPLRAAPLTSPNGT